jgi:hypothetical protein
LKLRNLRRLFETKEEDWNYLSLLFFPSDFELDLLKVVE